MKHLPVFIVCSVLLSAGCSTGQAVDENLMELYGVPLGYEPTNGPTLGIAAVGMSCGLNVQDNVERMKRYVETICAERPKVRLVVFGEIILGRYKMPDGEAYQRSVAETSGGPAATAMSALAAGYGVYIAYGFAEKDGNALYNSQILIGPDGKTVAVHRKMNAIGDDIGNGFAKGSTPTFADIDGIRTALAVSPDDKYKPFIDRLQAEKIELLLLSTAHQGVRSYDPEMTSRRFNCWTVSANRVGDERVDGQGYTFLRGTYISDPTGAVRAGATGTGAEEGYVFGTIRVRR